MSLSSHFYRKMKITCPIHSAANRTPTAIALRDAQHVFTYAETEAQVVACTRRLLALGMQSGNRVAILAANSVYYVFAIFALNRLGVSFVPLNLRWSPDSWRQTVARAGCVMILTDTEHATAAGSLNLPVFLLGGEKSKNGNRVSEPGGYKRTTLDLQIESSLFFTSGSSGEPKGVVLTLGNHYYNALGSNQNIPLQSGDCWLASLPFYHVGGISILFRCVLAGAAAAILPRVNWKELIESDWCQVITHISLVPTQLTQLIQSKKHREFLAGLKCILLGGAPLPVDLHQQIRDLKLPVLLTYGLTETASQVTTLTAGDPPEKLATTGRCLSYRQVSILNERGEPLSVGEVGEIAVRGEVLFAGYLNGEQKYGTNDWFRTGDLGFLDRDGYLFVRGRKDDLIISSGENIYPAEIENVARGFAGVSDCAVIGVDDSKWGQRPLLFVAATTPKSFPVAELRKYLKRKLAKILLPERIIVLAQLPKRLIGKVDRAELQRVASGKMRK